MYKLVLILVSILLFIYCSVIIIIFILVHFCPYLGKNQSRCAGINLLIFVLIIIIVEALSMAEDCNELVVVAKIDDTDCHESIITDLHVEAKDCHFSKGYYYYLYRS